MVSYVTTKDTSHVQEYHLYGASRLGTYTPQANDQGKLILGLRNYELTNHLGNVLAVISDKKKEDSTADIVSASDYYPFGMPLKSRSFERKKYRFGFNGKENDKNFGEGIKDYGFRLYDRRNAKFLSIDPLFKSYPELTTYQFASNKPIWAIDLDGLEAWETTSIWTTRHIKDYERFSKERLKYYSKEGATYDCADVAVRLLVDYATERQLDVSFTLINGTTVSASNSRFKNKEHFFEYVANSTRAYDLALANTYPIPENEAIVGDLNFQGFQGEDDKWVIPHTVLVYETNEKEGVSKLIYGNPNMTPKISGDWISNDANVGTFMLGEIAFMRWNQLHPDNLVDNTVKMEAIKTLTPILEIEPFQFGDIELPNNKKDE